MASAMELMGEFEVVEDAEDRLTDSHGGGESFARQS
jgi:hypothetical protein